jgi:23S rRNA (cytidine1920-2'-O)/16S rRNA (cytidine1409-2'-O)-methyltransferase
VARARRRLDVEIVERGLAASRERAQALILAGRVRVPGVERPKSGTAVDGTVEIDVDADDGWVSRGALKLLGALDDFGIACDDRVAVDVGSSTGGFTEVLLSRGARRVYAFDSGTAQMHQRLRTDPRVVLREKTNARRLSGDDLNETPDLVAMDVSFISVLKILPALLPLVAPRSDFVVLVKPQFEAGRKDVGPGGLVKDPSVHERVLLGVRDAAGTMGLRLLGASASRVAGPDMNREFFFHWTNDAARAPSGGPDLQTLARSPA